MIQKLLFVIFFLIQISYTQTVNVKDSEDHTLIQINDEGDTGGSITLPDASSVATPDDKLYNIAGELRWDGRLLDDCEITREEFNALMSDYDALELRVLGLEGECIPEAEVCDYLDNNCNGLVDETWKTGEVYTATEACGNCYTDCSEIYNIPNAHGVCDASGTPICDYICETGFIDLNGNPLDGCEFLENPVAIYVAKPADGGSISGTCGSFNEPCATIGLGISRAEATGKSDIIVAKGLYVETVTLVESIDIKGGYNPTDWSRDPSLFVTRIQGTDTGFNKKTIIAININSQYTTVDGFRIDGQDNSASGGNTYVIWIKDSDNNLIINNNEIYAGDGGDGTNGSNGSNGDNGVPGSPGIDAFDVGTETCTSSHYSPGGAGGTKFCGPTSISGGSGGERICPYFDGTTTDAPITSENGESGDNGGGSGGSAGWDVWHQAYTCLGYETFGTVLGGDGENGSDGLNGAQGAGSSVEGTVVSSEWVPGDGSSAAAGTHGSGAGGGGSGAGAAVHSTCFSKGYGYDNIGATGGGGGSGACGGDGGSEGTGGGGSFGIFVSFTTMPSTVPVITENEIYLGSGGDGGDGGAGGIGGDGGAGAPGGIGEGSMDPADPTYPSFSGGSGGNGGDGGHGGGAGGGCGGVSYGIYANGHGGINLSAWGLSNIFTNVGSAGTGGSGGLSFGNSGGDGADGTQADTNF